MNIHRHQPAQDQIETTINLILLKAVNSFIPQPFGLITKPIYQDFMARNRRKKLNTTNIY